MKKIKLNFKNMKEVLSRDELKAIVGGYSSGIGSGNSKCLCKCDYHEGSWYSDDCTGGNSTYCRDSDNRSPGPYSCS